MSHFAEIDKNQKVLRVIVAEQDFINSGAVGDSFNWIQTSYNNNFRKQFAIVGGIYDKLNDVFLASKPYPSWTLDSNFDWQSPKPRPESDVINYPYVWNEETKNWDEKT
tara:strand:- start:3849 stop:4175 length:327 start_codon:yes stop_codon:yes gene_type:complete